MAEPVLLDDLRAWYGGYALNGYLNRCNFKLANAELKAAQFGDTIDALHPGLLKPEVMLGGFYKAGAGTPDAVAGSRVIAGTVTSLPLSLAPPSAPATTPGADGNLAYLITGADFMYEIGSAHGELLPYSLKRMPRSGAHVVRGTVVLPASSVTATTTGTGRLLGAVAATQKIVCALHVLAVNGGTWTLTIESDDNAGFTSATTRLTFTGATAIGSEVQAYLGSAGAITDTYWRAVLTKSGGTSCTAAVVLGIAPL